MGDTRDPYESIGYAIFRAHMAKDCRCCYECRGRPCDGVLAGGVCDQARCRCDDETDDYGDDEADGSLVKIEPAASGSEGK